MSIHTTPQITPGAPVPVIPNRLLCAEDVAQLLGVPPGFVYALARRGEIPAIRVGERYIRFRPAALQDWIETKEAGEPAGRGRYR